VGLRYEVVRRAALHRGGWRLRETLEGSSGFQRNRVNFGEKGAVVKGRGAMKNLGEVRGKKRCGNREPALRRHDGGAGGRPFVWVERVERYAGGVYLGGENCWYVRYVAIKEEPILPSTSIRVGVVCFPKSLKNVDTFLTRLVEGGNQKPSTRGTSSTPRPPRETSQVRTGERGRLFNAHTTSESNVCGGNVVKMP